MLLPVALLDSIYNHIAFTVLLGNPPNQITNNLVESFNNVIKEEMANQRLDLVSFLEYLKTRVFDYQTSQMAMVVKKMGDYRLSAEYAHLAVEPTDWKNLMIEQQKAKVEAVVSLVSPNRYM